MVSARYYSRVLVPLGLNLQEFVCERGVAYMYYQDFAEDFFPLEAFVKQVKDANDQSRGGNYDLRRELKVA
jgi:hypothetical protein